MKSRVKGDFQARFRENVEVRFLDVTRLAVIVTNDIELIIKRSINKLATKAKTTETEVRYLITNVFAETIK